MRDLIAGDCNGYVNLFLETGSGLHNAGHVKRDSSGILVDIQVNANSFVCIQDWNEDGNKDMIIGEADRQPPNTGNVRAYLNDSLNSTPSFKDYSLIFAGGEPLWITHANPVVIDLDNNSIKDLVLGNTNGYVYFFRNTGTNELPRFSAEYETLRTTSGNFIDALTLSRPCFVDWTNDGDIDMILGGQDGYVWLCENATITICQESPEIMAGPRFRVIGNPIRLPILLKWNNIFDQEVDIELYDIAGRMASHTTLDLENRPDGIYSWQPFTHDTERISCGIYFIRLRGKNIKQTLKLIITP